MLTHPTLDKLHQLRLLGMAKAFEEQMHMSDVAQLSTEERLGLMVDRELTARADRRLQTRLRQAKLRHAATVEDIDYRHARGLDRTLMAQLAGCAWLGAHHNILITGPAGIGKSWLACALAQKACREGFSARYVRAPRFFRELVIAMSYCQMWCTASLRSGGFLADSSLIDTVDEIHAVDDVGDLLEVSYPPPPFLSTHGELMHQRQAGFGTDAVAGGLGT